VRIDYSLCGVKMLDLHLCLSASVNVRYVLHTQPLRFIYNNVLVWVSLYSSLSLYLSLLDYPSHLLHPFSKHCKLFVHLPYLSFFYLINPYSSDGKRRDLQRLWQWQQQHQESITSRLLSSCWSCRLNF
jgi:hypothetical protein